MSEEDEKEEVEVEEVSPVQEQKAPELTSFYDALHVHKKAVDEKFPQAGEAERFRMAVACLDAQMTVLHMNTMAQALALPDRQSMYEALAELRQRHVDLTNRYNTLAEAYKNVQRQLNGLDRRR